MQQGTKRNYTTATPGKHYEVSLSGKKKKNHDNGVGNPKAIRIRSFSRAQPTQMLSLLTFFHNVLLWNSYVISTLWMLLYATNITFHEYNFKYGSQKRPQSWLYRIKSSEALEEGNVVRKLSLPLRAGLWYGILNKWTLNSPIIHLATVMYFPWNNLRISWNGTTSLVLDAIHWKFLIIISLEQELLI